ncbi:calmodulin-regulated spectrin-associated protein 3 isoform X2 [Danio rerio]|uniref:Calmodulin-regulated spectrin-associated protein 3 isoform X2 n=1 Tax=Danio rerio TaxID=7955 RepID=A0A8M2BIC2_DANRE|nr:calmodulin-regulated spectrin-associated protein 3-like isoform X2 [Danio rerio]|eukprot:XP_005171117.1 calmodulin-regulated spectrin-associated protein 3-like isoform X2 [Danio rerio]
MAMDAPAVKQSAPVPDICPLDRYEPSQAKTRASLSWLLSRSGPEESVSSAVCADGSVCVSLQRRLLSAELYCRVFSGVCVSAGGVAPADLPSLLLLLDRLHLTPSANQTQLSQTPIHMGAHLALIDSLMSLSAMETVARVKMAKETDQFGSGKSWENSLLFWINKVNQKLRDSADVEENVKPNTCTDLQPVQPTCPQRWYWKLVPHAIAFCLKESGNKPPVIRYRKDKVQSKQSPVFSVVSGVKDLSSGCAIAAALHFYCPQILPLEDVCLKDTMCVADSVYNLQLIREFYRTHLKSCCPLQLEDLLYAPPILQVNIMCFLSELFATFEVQKPDFVKPIHTLDLTDASDLVDCTSPINCNSGSPSFLLKQSLPQSTSVSGRGWSKKQISRPLSAVTFSIPFPLDSDVDVVMGNPLFRSVSTDSLTMVTNPDPYTPPEDLSKLIGHAPLGELPTIEEALQIVHTGRVVHNEPRLRPEGAPSGFYLHSQNEGGAKLSSSAPCRSGIMYRPIGGGPDNSGNHKRQDGGSECATPDSPKTSSPANGPKSGRMTNFAERRKMMPESPSNSRSQEREPLFSPAAMSPVGAMEAQELGARLEEKRKAIEAQKRRIEAIFTKHRQRLGKTAFLQLQKKQEGEVEEDGQSISLDERLTQMEQQLQQVEDREKEEEKRKQEEGKREKDGEEKKSDVVAPPKLEKQVTFSVEAKKEEGKEPPLGEYNEAVAKLSSTLETLQRDMQRLTEQQQRLMGKKTLSSPKNIPSSKTSASSKAWIIPSGPKSPATPPHLSRDSTRIISPSGSPSRSGQLSDTPRSPKSSAASTPRRSRSSAPKSPRRQRPSRPTDLGFQPITRVLTPPQNVDTLPHLRRVSPSQCQVQTSSSLRLGGPYTPLDSSPQPAPAQENTSESGSSDHNTPIFSLELEAGPPSALPAELLGGAGSSGAPSECSFESDLLLSSAPVKDETEGAGTMGDDTDLEQGAEIFSSDSMSDQTESESRLGLDVFFKEEGLSEEEMAQKRALLLERQQRRAQELKRRARQGQDPENSQQASLEDLRPQTPLLSQSLPTFYTPPPHLNATPPGTPQRWGAFTRAEYERRHQLKIMADLGKVLKQKPTKQSGKKQHANKPHNHELIHTRSPGKSSTANQKDGRSLPAVKPASRLESPSKVMSSGLLASQNGEKDCEQASNASSPASLPEYTGPKLFKEPSFKSNKFIIHSALSRCCLAGKVNESQKNKIIEEMEKSSASHFLILMRDSNCQFRAIYTLDGQSEELHRLCGVGPRVISSSAVEAIYKYSSDRKQFNTLPSRTLSMSVDAFTIPGQLWNTKKHGTPKKVATPK